MKFLYKTVRVVQDWHLKEYRVDYRNFLFWKRDSSYKWDEDTRNPTYYRTQEQAKTKAIDRAEGMLHTIEIYKKSNYTYYV
jgi:hypothetical protein